MKSTRREFLKQAVVTGIAAAGLPKILEAADTSSITPAKSKVIVATDKDAYKDDVVNQAKLDAMMDKIITKLTGKANVKAAWSSLFNSKDVGWYKSKLFDRSACINSSGSCLFCYSRIKDGWSKRRQYNNLGPTN